MQSCLCLKCTLKNGNGGLDKVISLTVVFFIGFFSLLKQHTSPGSSTSSAHEMRRNRSLLLFPELEVDIEIQRLTEIKKRKRKKNWNVLR